MCGCLSQDTTGMIDAGVLPCGHTKWISPNELSDRTPSPLRDTLEVEQ